MQSWKARENTARLPWFSRNFGTKWRENYILSKNFRFFLKSYRDIFWVRNGVNTHGNSPCIECVRSCDQKPYLHNETKGGICKEIEFNPQKSISLLQHGRRFFVYSSNMAAVTSCEHTLFNDNLVTFFFCFFFYPNVILVNIQLLLLLFIFPFFVFFWGVQYLIPT